MKHTANAGIQKNPKQMYVTDFFTDPLERRNRKSSLESRLKWVNIMQTVPQQRWINAGFPPWRDMFNPK
jgi:hypothetical protein